MPETRISWKEFRRVVQEAVASLPTQFLARMENVVVDVAEAPSARDLAHLESRESAGASDGVLLGLFVGVPLTEQSYGERHRNCVKIFRRPLQQVSRNRQALIQNIRATVVHELAHHFGFSEDDLAAFEESQKKWLD